MFRKDQDGYTLQELAWLPQEPHGSSEQNDPDEYQ